MFSEVVALRPAFPRIAFLAVCFALCICFASPVSAVLKCSENSACLATETEEAPRGDRWLCAQERATFQAGDSAECVGLVCEQVPATQRRAVCLPEPACVLCASRLRRWDRNRPRLPAAPPPFPGFWLPSLPRVLRYSMRLRHCPKVHFRCFFIMNSYTFISFPIPLVVSQKKESSDVALHPGLCAAMATAS